MQPLQYYSVADLDISDAIASFLDQDCDEKEVSEDAPERWDKAELSDFFNESYHDCFPGPLAEEVHNFVRLVAHPYRRCFDKPAKSPKNEEIESAIKNKGTPGCCTFKRDEGKFLVQPLAEWMCYGHNLRRKHYYTSDSRIALLYHDIDCHLEYQTKADSDAARSLIEKETLAHLGVSPLFLNSSRGENGYMKVDLAGVEPKRANEVFDEYQEAIRLLFAKHRIMADFEIKGTVTWMDPNGKLQAGRYGKLPMCASRWDYRWHRSLVTARKVTIAQIEAFIKKVKAEVSAEDIARHEEAKQRAFVTHYLPVGDEQRWRLIAQMSLGIFEEKLVSYKRQPWIARSQLSDATIKKLWPDYQPDICAEPSNASQPVDVPVDEVGPSPEPSNKVAKNTDKDLANIGKETDSFVRQRKALLKLARLLKRVPTVDEALRFIQENGLYTGAWANPARRIRVRGILKFIAKTFDTKKCTKQGKTTATVNIGKYDAWAKAKFPNGIGGGKRRIVTDDFQIRTISKCGRIEWEFISVFVSVCEYCLLVEQNPDGSLPHKRAKALWKWLHGKKLITVKYDDRKWSACRDGLEKYGVIKVTDRNYEANKAMKWAIGPYFPLLGLWKTKKEPSLLDPITWDQFMKKLANTADTQQGRHNSLLRQKSAETLVVSLFGSARPPPGINSG
jgi:hypothetical protein